MTERLSRRLCVAAVALLMAPAVARGQGDVEYHRLADLTLDLGAQTTVIGARKVDPKLFAASFFQKDLQCTSSLVGPRVLLTAAHCVAAAATVKFQVNGQPYSAICDHAPAYHPKTNKTADYALCLVGRDVNDTPYFETISIDPARLRKDQELLLTGFGCTKAGGGGSTSGTVYRVGESVITVLPTKSDNRIITEGDAAVCYGDSGGPAFLQRKGDDGGPRIQVSVNAVGNIRDKSGLASLSTPTALSFLRDWSASKNVRICGLHPEAVKCKNVP
jgi:hypothetical protein